MRKQSALFWWTLTFLSFLFSSGLGFASVSNLLSLKEENIDVGLLAFTMSREVYPDLNISSYSAKLDALAHQVRRLARGTADPDQRIRCLNTVLHQSEKFHASRETSLERKPGPYFLNHLLDTKQGNCLSLPLLYVALGQRLGWPLYLVHVPDHSFVRYVDPSFQEQNIEATSGGGYVPDERYAQDFKVSAKGLASGAYLRTLTYRETLADLVTTTAVALGQQGQLSKAITHLTLATKLNPRLVDAWANLANAYRMMAKRTTGPDAEKYLKLAAACSKKLADLGFVHPKEVPPFTSTRRLF